MSDAPAEANPPAEAVEGTTPAADETSKPSLFGDASNSLFKGVSGSVFGQNTEGNSNIFTSAPVFGAKPAAAAGGEDGAANEEDDDADAGADESHAADFAPLLEGAQKVEVKTMEEDEDIIFESRAKLFIFIKKDVYGDEVRENWWKERGLGKVKLLKHREMNVVRLLMRQEKTLKVCANFLVSPEIDLVKNVGSDKTWMFAANDFSEGEIKAHYYCLKLPSPEVTEDFREQIEVAKKLNAAAQSSEAVDAADAANDAEASAPQSEEQEQAASEVAASIDKLAVEGNAE